MTIADRLKIAIKAKGIPSAAELARRTGLNPVTLRAYIADERNPPLHICETIGDALGFHGRWLFDGTGPKEFAKPLISDGINQVVTVPIVDQVTAGKLVEPSSQIPLDDLPKVLIGNLDPGEFFALRVSGSSMDRISPEGSIIIVDRKDRRRVSGRCYVFSVKGETTYKRWQDGDIPMLEPYSTDPTHKAVPIKRKGDVEVIGRVRKTILDL